MSFLFEGSQASKNRASLDWPIATPFLDLRVRTENRKVAEYCQSERTRAGRQWTATNRRGRPERAPSVGGWSWKRRFSALGRHFVLVIAADREWVAVSFQGEGSAPGASLLFLPSLSASRLGLVCCANRLQLSWEGWWKWRLAEVMSGSPPLTTRAEKSPCRRHHPGWQTMVAAAGVAGK